jgi:hypothetical protein
MLKQFPYLAVIELKSHSTGPYHLLKSNIFLQDDDDLAERALDGLRQVMMVKSYVVLPYLIPQVKIHLHIQV